MNSLGYKELLEKLISIKSPFFYEEEIALFLENLLNDMDFVTFRQEVNRVAIIDGHRKKFTHFNVLGEKGDGEKSFLLYGHIDTVPPVSAWYDMGIDPYRAVTEGDKIIGLGTSDMKGGVCSILKAVENIVPEGYKIKICFGVDEEYESTGAYVLVNSDFIKDCIACIVPEVGSGFTEPAMENLIIGRHGRNRVGVRVRGHAAHAATPAFIINPVEYALEFIKKAKKIDLGYDPHMDGGNISVASIHAEGGGLSSPEECFIWFDNIFSPPRTSSGIFKDYISICERLNVKYEKMDGKKEGLHFSTIDLQNLSEKDRELFSPRATPFMEPWKIDISEDLVKCASRVIFDVTGKKAVITCGSSNADENYIGQIMPTVVIPPLGGNEHQGGEYVFLSSVKNASEIIRKIVIDFMNANI